MIRARRVLPALAALALLLLAARSVPARAPSGDAWLLTIAARPGGDSSSGGMRAAGQAGAGADGCVCPGGMPAEVGQWDTGVAEAGTWDGGTEGAGTWDAGMEGHDQWWEGRDERRWIAAAWSGSMRVLTGGFHSASSPAPDFEATRFLFVGRRRAGDRPAIWEMRIDGSGVRRIAAGQGDPRDPAFMPDGRIVFSDAAGAGARALFACRPDGSDLQRLTFGADHDIRPGPLDDGRIRFDRVRLASGRAAEVVPMTIHPDGTGVARDTTARPAPEGAAAAPAAPAGYRLVGARRIAPREAPPVLTSVIDPARRTGTLLCLDVHSSQLPGIARLERGAVARVRAEVLRPAAAPGPATILGEAVVQPDGSFLIEVPADTPLRLTLVGADGRDLASHDAGVWVRPKENRGCVGCHEPPDLAPENRRPRAVDQDPVRLTGAPPAEGPGAR